MKMTTRGRYALRATLALARAYGDQPLAAGALARRESLSLKYLHALLTSLKRAGLVSTIRGPGGGFRLARPPARIRLSEILRAAEGPLSLVECVSCPAHCRRADLCTARKVWAHLSKTIENVLDDLTLDKLLKLETRPGGSVRPPGQRPRGGERRREDAVMRPTRRAHRPTGLLSKQGKQA